MLAYANVVDAKIAAGWTYGMHGNLLTWLGWKGSCSEWQWAVYSALCAVPDIHCWHVCMVRSAWHRAVVIWPKGQKWDVAGQVLDPWFSGTARVYTITGWKRTGLWWVWKGECCH